MATRKAKLKRLGSLVALSLVPSMNVLRLASAVAEGETMTVGSHVFEFDYDGSVTAGRLKIDLSGAAGAAAGTSTLTSNNTNVTDGDTVTIGSTVYRFKNTMSQAYDVKIGADADASLLNLIRAINGSGTVGTDWFVGTAVHPTVSAATSVTSHAFLITSKAKGTAQNAIATTDTATTLSWTGSTLANGADATGDQAATIIAAQAGTLQSSYAFERPGANEVLVRSKTSQTFPCTETLAGSNNAWAVATSYGGADASERSNQIFSRVPNAAEVAIGRMHFPVGFTPVAALAAVRVTSTGVIKAHDGALILAAGRVTLDNTGSTDWATTDTVTVIAS